VRVRLTGPPLLVGVVHLLPLPGSPRRSPGLDAVLARAVADARALADGGADAVIVENLGDAPFDAGPVAPATVAAMTRAAHAVRLAAPQLHLGVNVLRNDARAAVGIAAAVGASFVRINVHVGAMVTDQGVVEGRARETLLERARLGADLRIVADVLVKHAVPLGPWSLEDAARDTAHRGLADVLVVTGAGTGRPTDPSHVARVRHAVPEVPVWVGSGLDPSGVATSGPFDGAIVGTWLHRDGDLDAPLDVDRVRGMAEALRSSGGR
jgi:uncharacterized protein